jgi:hypothetical protein
MNQFTGSKETTTPALPLGLGMLVIVAHVIKIDLSDPAEVGRAKPTVGGKVR